MGELAGPPKPRQSACGPVRVSACIGRPGAASRQVWQTFGMPRHLTSFLTHLISVYYLQDFACHLIHRRIWCKYSAKVYAMLEFEDAIP